MAILLTGPVGRVGVVRGGVPGLIRGLVSVRPRLSFGSHKVILSRMAIEASLNYQVVHSLGRPIYMTLFGDRVGQTALTGLAVTGPSNSLPGGCNLAEPAGVDMLVAYYQAARGRKIQIVLSQVPIIAVLVGLSLDANDAATYAVNFKMNLEGIPYG